MARPKLEIDERMVESFAKLGATYVEIAEHFGCNEDTIRKRFSGIVIKARASKQIRLRQLQWQLAEKGNLGMLIWLGKQMLGQSEKVESQQSLTLTGAHGGPVQVSNLSSEERETEIERLIKLRSKTLNE